MRAGFDAMVPATSSCGMIRRLSAKARSNSSTSNMLGCSVTSLLTWIILSVNCKSRSGNTVRKATRRDKACPHHATRAGKQEGRTNEVHIRQHSPESNMGEQRKTEVNGTCLSMSRSGNTVPKVTGGKKKGKIVGDMPVNVHSRQHNPENNREEQWKT
jgi:hypothetical protein